MDNILNQTANKLGLDFFYHHRPEVINPIEKDVYIGFTTIPNVFTDFTYYQPSVQVNQNSILAQDMKQKNITAYKYGVFTYMGHIGREDSSKTLESIGI